MHSHTLIAAMLSAMLLGTAAMPAAADPQSAAEANVGFVYYTKSLAPGTLNARWMLSTKYKGPGIATGVGMEVDGGLAVGWRRVGE